MAKTPWGERMEDLMDFIRAHTVDLWKPNRDREWLVYKKVNQRFRITAERQHGLYDNPEAYAAKGIVWDVWGMDMARVDFFRDQYDPEHPERYVDVDTKDRVLFAKQLEQTLFQNTSYMDRRYIIAMLLEMQREDDGYRKDVEGYVPDPVASREELGLVAQTEERQTENLRVGGSTPPEATTPTPEEMWDNFIMHEARKNPKVFLKDGKLTLKCLLGSIDGYKKSFLEAQQFEAH